MEMDAWIYDAKGQCRYLPTLLSWDISHGFCSPCDCFEVCFVYLPEMLEPLREACRFRADYDGKTVFYGVVDELELNADAGGCTAVLRGRGMQALLMDSQAEQADYAAADLSFVLNRHVQALGVTQIGIPERTAGKAALSVRSGESHWSVVQRFCEFCLGLRPRFAPDGTLLLDGEDSGRAFRISGETPVTAQRLIQDRYGVISDILVKNRRAGTKVTVENPPFKALGGNCIRVLNVPRYTGFDAMRHTGQYQIEKSAAEFLRCRITLPTCFAAFPGDRVTVSDSPLGLKGVFVVESSRCYADGRSAGTVLELRPDTA